MDVTNRTSLMLNPFTGTWVLLDISCFALVLPLRSIPLCSSDLKESFSLIMHKIINKHHALETISRNMQMLPFSLNCHLEAIHNTPKLSLKHTTETKSPREDHYELAIWISQNSTTTSLDTARSQLRVLLQYLLLFALSLYISETPSTFKLTCTILLLWKSWTSVLILAMRLAFVIHFCWKVYSFLLYQRRSSTTPKNTTPNHSFHQLKYCRFRLNQFNNSVSQNIGCPLSEKSSRYISPICSL